MKNSDNNQYYFEGQKKYYIENDEFNINYLIQAILRRKKFVLSSTVFLFTITLIFTTFQRIFNPVYKGSFSMLTDDPMLENTANNPSNRSDANITALQYTQYEDIALGKSSYDNDTLIELLKSPIYLNLVEKDLDLPKSSISKIISIKPPETNLIGSNKKIINGVLNVEINSKNRLKGEMILNKLADIYLKSSLERRQQRLNDGLKFLDKQAPSIEEKKQELQKEIVSFREKNKLLFPSEEGKNIKVQQNSIENQILNINSTRDRLLNIRDQIVNGKLTGMGFKEKLGESFLIRVSDQETLSELIALEIEIANAKTKFTKDSSIIKNLNSRLNSVQSDLRIKQIEAIDTALKLNAGDLKSAKMQKIDIENKFIKQPELIKEYKNLEQNLNFTNQNLLGLEKARESFQLEIAQNTIPWRIISPPEMEDKPYKPKFLNNLFTGTFLGILFGLLIALIRDKMDNVFHSPNELAKIIESPILGTIPYLDDILNIFKNDNKSEISAKTEFINETFRYLYNSIKHSSDSKESVKVFAISSSIPSEGKNVISILLSKVIASMDKRILLIDADMRKPSIHDVFLIANDYGLSDILLKDFTSWESGVKVDNDNKLLDIITAGAIPPDPSKILASESFKNFVENLREKQIYDFIILNTTPLLGLTDALLISEQVDSVLLAVSINKVNKNYVKESIFRLSKISNLKMIGLIPNYVKRYEYQYYGHIDYLNYNDDLLKNYTKNFDQTDKTFENKISSNFRKNKYFILFYKNFKKFIRWLNQ